MSGLAREIVSVFAHVQRANEHGAGFLQSLNERRIGCCGGPLAIDPGARQRRHALDIKKILHREWDASEWSRRFAVSYPRIDCACRGPRSIRRDSCECIERSIAG